MFEMFRKAENLKYVPSLNTSKVTNMSRMFYICVNLEEIPDFDYSKVTNVQGMFQGTKIRSFQANLPLVTDASNMFQNCENLQDVTITFGNNVVYLLNTFYECNSLQTIGTLNVPNVTSMIYCFRNCTALTTIGGLVGLKADVDFKDCRNLSNESIQNLIDNAADVTSLGTKTMKFNATPFATITEEQTAAATAKGWTLAKA